MCGRKGGSGLRNKLDHVKWIVLELKGPGLKKGNCECACAVMSCRTKRPKWTLTLTLIPSSFHLNIQPFDHSAINHSSIPPFHHSVSSSNIFFFVILHTNISPPTQLVSRNKKHIEHHTLLLRQSSVRHRVQLQRKGCERQSRRS